jgi:hypothetical protein
VNNNFCNRVRVIFQNWLSIITGAGRALDMGAFKKEKQAEREKNVLITLVTTQVHRRASL